MPLGPPKKQALLTNVREASGSRSFARQNAMRKKWILAIHRSFACQRITERFSVCDIRKTYALCVVVPY